MWTFRFQDVITSRKRMKREVRNPGRLAADRKSCATPRLFASYSKISGGSTANEFQKYLDSDLSANQGSKRRMALDTFLVRVVVSFESPRKIRKLSWKTGTRDKAPAHRYSRDVHCDHHTMSHAVKSSKHGHGNAY